MLIEAQAEAKAAGRDPARVNIAGWRLHDLRRTCATGIGIAPHIVEAVLNHVSGAKAGVAGTYNRAVYAAEKEVARERRALHVAHIGAPRSRAMSRSWARTRRKASVKPPDVNGRGRTRGVDIPNSIVCL
jgi:hypothetical protein